MGAVGASLAGVAGSVGGASVTEPPPLGGAEAAGAGEAAHEPWQPVGLSVGFVAGPGSLPTGVVPGPRTCAGTSGFLLTSLLGSFGVSFWSQVQSLARYHQPLPEGFGGLVHSPGPAGVEVPGVVVDV